ncbi:MAG: molybdopterin-dependent oxidoreductase [Actinomycetes bacterium]
MSSPWRNHSSHGGAFLARLVEGNVEVAAHPLDTGQSQIWGNLTGQLDHPARVRRPAIRRGWLEQGPGPSAGRGVDPFVEVEWTELFDLLAAELERVYSQLGPESVFAGSYGWASAGRFHHAQSQLHRFLNLLGGYVRSVNTYSIGASAVIIPHVLGVDVSELVQRATTWESIAEHSEVVLAFGGISVKNASVAPGGATDHVAAGRVQALHDRGVEFHLFAPLRDDLPVPATWWALRPATDVAVILGLAHTIVNAGQHDSVFLARYCQGWPQLEAYLLGTIDGIPKDADWAANISGLPAVDLRALALSLPGKRVLVQTSWSLQRADHGEQPIWAGIALAAVLGQIGLPGGGFGHGYGSMASVGSAEVLTGVPALPQGVNPVRTFIPVARAADMLRNPGAEYDYNGQRLTYPDVRLVYWCGGNPFHHHQDLGQLRQAWARPETIVVHDPWWTAAAKHADIVIPSTTSLERDDLGGNVNDRYLQAMHAVTPRVGASRDDYEVFSELAARLLGSSEPFTEGRNQMDWIRQLYSGLVARANKHEWPLPPFAEFWDRGYVELPTRPRDTLLLGRFRADPLANPLATPSGRIELYSERIASFGYDDCPPHPSWLEPREWLGGPLAEHWPLHLVANQPAGRLHSQLDMGAVSQSMKTSGRETLRIHPDDAAARGVSDGDVVQVLNDRGSCLAGAQVTDTVRAGVVQLPTGAWFDPRDLTSGDTLCLHGNPNVLTADRGTSSLSQGCTGQHTLVEVVLWTGDTPEVRAHRPPLFAEHP